MKIRYIPPLLLAAGLLMGAGIPNFFAGLIGDNVQKFCEEKSSQEQLELIKSVNLYTGSHEVVVVCSEKVAQAEANDSKTEHRRNSNRIAR